MASMTKYTYLDTPRGSREDEHDLLEKSPELNYPSPNLERRRRTVPLWLVVVLCLSLSCVSALLSATAVSHTLKRNLTTLCLAQESAGSPLTKDVPISYKEIQFEGNFLEENVYRRPASPEVDAAWNDLGVNNRSVAVPVEHADRFGLTKDHVQIKAKYGGGFPANVEALHQLHCLNLVRKSLYYNIDYYRAQGEGAFTNEEFIVQKHVSHCVDVIRQQLMCSADIGVMGQVWYTPDVGQSPKAFVDFNTHHVCRNYDDIREWARNHQLPLHVEDDFLEPPKPDTQIHSGVP